MFRIFAFARPFYTVGFFWEFFPLPPLAEQTLVCSQSLAFDDFRFYFYGGEPPFEIANWKS